MDKRYEVPAGFVNRRMLREQANVSEHELKTLEGQALLKSSGRNNGGWHLYSASDVDRVRKLVEEMRERRRSASTEEPTRLLPAYKETNIPYDLEQYRAVYTHFKKGTPLDEIPMVVDVHPSIISVILKDAKHLAGAFVVAKPIVDAINNIPFRDLPSIRSGDDLLKALEKISESSENKPTLCQSEDENEEPCKKPAKVCLACAKKLVPTKPPKKPDEAEAPAAPAAHVAKTRERRPRREAPRDSGSAPT